MPKKKWESQLPSSKKYREITGLTFQKISENADLWLSQANEFKNAAECIYDSSGGAPNLPYYFLVSLSFELALKALAIAGKYQFEKNHNLMKLANLTRLPVNEDQNYTLELLSEIIVWSGRYPVPKKEGQWDNYWDSVLEKHIVRERRGNTYNTRVHQGRFPTQNNISAIWILIQQAYAKTKPWPAKKSN
ncbi:MAG TPA: HEPN domain-containing protein [Gammaproteobacteria bacterium]|nr:HEPN domain-containing protein [Gammaproteobacteria bacterium]